ncbi:MAG: TRAP transporter substrate-binding protein [Azospirillum sp.]|jgi:tripartite ATP-independent transporter DctP family solute receptor|nr:TRAP transporter substrate-binding protein [Azospirillum sp.]MCZ8122727.1 TRAP transporter substrate-binding protein [Magnetospirillum sp.]
MTDISRRGLGAALAGAAAFASFPALAQRAAAARIGVVQPENAPNTAMWRRFAELARERTGGAVELQVFPGGQLGGERENAEGMRLGSIQGADSTLAALSQWVPEGQIFDMPFVFRDWEHVDKVVNGPIGERYKALYRAQGFEVPAFFTYGARHVLSRQPVNTVADVRGKTMRVLQSPLHIAIWRALGANPTPIPITETYNALSTGVADMMDLTKGPTETLRIFEVAPHMTETGHIWAVGAIVFSRQYWQRLSADHQRTMTTTAVEMARYINGLHKEQEDAAVARMGARGMRVIKVDEAPWREAMRPVWEAEAPKFGGMNALMEIVNTR